jgi:dTDP-glucose pyrophosphorylase
MKKVQHIIVGPETSIRETIRVIDVGSIQLALVASPDGRLLGTVTDGDIRRAILRNIPLDEPTHRIMNPSPTTVHAADGREEILSKMRAKQLRQIPVVDDEGRIVTVEVLTEMIGQEDRRNSVVIMAGGHGIRLRPLTEKCPKPLLKIGNKPLLERIIENFVEYGFRHFYLAVNYMADMVVEHFGDGSALGAQIEYIREDKKMGTAGALGLLGEQPTQPLIVMNGDLLTKVNFQHLLDFHNEHGAEATMCVREYDFQVPYGVVQIANHRILTIEEKPVQRFFVNAGIYVLNPSTLNLVPRGEYCDMPDLLQGVVSRGGETAVFPVREYWLDIGQMEDFRRANGEFAEIFG